MPPPKKVILNKEETSSTSKSRGNVVVEKGATLSLPGNNFAKVSVSINLPFDPTEQDISASKKSIKIAMAIVDAELGKQIDNLKELLE